MEVYVYCVLALLVGALPAMQQYAAPNDTYSTTCQTAFFLCGASQRCIPRQWVCDYEQDCPDGEDEQQSCPPPACKGGEFACGEYKWNHTYCVPQHHRCDKVQDCADNADEKGCNYRECNAEDFKCGSGLCVPPFKKCNGYLDCRDHSDEDQCDGTACSLDKLRCKDGKGCIEKDQKCDHRKDCEDGSDEEVCYLPACRKGQFRCDNGMCIPHQWKCDSSTDCLDGSDESDCQAVDCPEGQFLCEADRKCINGTKLCDATADCTDRADEEIDTCSTDLCESLQCEYNCRPSMDGGMCLCPEGKALAGDGRLCDDINECKGWGVCDQFCTNTEGSFRCLCEVGYQLNGTTCRAENSEALRLYYAHEKKIVRLDPRHPADAEVVVNTTAASGIDYHYQRDMLFWSDVDTQKVYRSRLNNDPGAAVLKISTSTAWAPVSVAVDWIGDNIYVADMIGQKVDVFDIDGRYHAIVISYGLTSPRDVALDPLLGYMFIADQDRIVRANMDGSELRALVSDAIYRASGVTVDIINKRVYLCSSLLGFIETVDYDGENRFPVLRGSTNAPAPSRLTTFERSIYWTDAMRQSVIEVDKFNGISSIRNVHTDKGVTGDLKAIKAVHQLLQPQLPTPCGESNGMCEHLCLLTRNTEGTGLGHRCACQVGYYLRADKMGCAPVQEFLMYSQQRFIKGQVLDPAAVNETDAMMPIVSRKARFVGLDFDYLDGKIYYSDADLDVIYRVNLNGTGHENILASQDKGVEGLALDWISGNLYYTDTATLNVISTGAARIRRTLLTKLARPRAIVVHPNKGYIFLSEWGRPANISRAYADGTHVEVFRGLVLGWPNGLSIDYDSDRLYWCDALLDHVRHTKLDGTDIKTITSPSIGHPFSLVIFKEHIYMTDWRLDAIVRLNKLSGANETIVARVQEFNRLYGVKVYARDVQKIDPDHPCRENNGGCEGFCFPIPSNETTNGLVARCETAHAA
ncbi:low-density lipoprotein receptor-related protein 2-like [Pollicipes pollicipes]|uniref:low-density lipoprotein receptor-related protein 2-like n=1 Tax=Pollicipes pollicipes TaxID=41117 RepID=UPI0018856C25|nr:low-density lipoprotein receptor-related protein 2-like [Pollicipes pollicipes]